MALALLAAVLFGASAPFAKLLLRDAAPQLLAGLLYAGSGLGLLVMWLLRRRGARSAEAPLTRADLPWMTGAITAGGIVAPLLLLIGLGRTPASAAMDHTHAHVHDIHHKHAHGPGDPPVIDPLPHVHPHHHEPLVHPHAHYPDLHHRHGHEHE